MNHLKKYRNQNRLWNGWGNIYSNYYKDSIQSELKNFLIPLLGEPILNISITRQEMLENIPESNIKIPEKYSSLKNFVYLDKDIRLDYSFGQSFPDWLSFKMGWNLKFTDAVAIPNNIEELKQVYEFCKENHYKLIIYGGGTSVVGHIRPENLPVITLSMENFNRVLEINKDSQFALIQAGANGPEIENQLNSYGYRLGHYPQSFEFSTLGGWIVTRSSGQQSLYYGKIEDIFLGGNILTEQGILSIFPVPASSAGIDLKYFILGSEGRMGILYEAYVKIRKLPEIEEFYGIFFENTENAIEFIKKAVYFKTNLSMIRLSFPEETFIQLEMAKSTGHKKTIEYLLKYLNFKGYKNNFCIMILGFTGTSKEVKESKKFIFRLIKDYKGIYKPYLISKKLGKNWEKNRFSTPYLRNILWDSGYGVDTLETCLTWDKIKQAKSKIEEAIKSAAEKFNEKVIVYTHISHVYLNGSSLYTTLIFRLKKDPDELYQFWKAMKEAASNAIIELNGTISHQHGVGKDHKMYLVKEKGNIGMDWIKNLIINSDKNQIFNNNNMIDL